MSPTEHKNKKLSDFAVNLGLIYNIFLAVLKTFFGVVGHSAGLLSDGINSTSDVVYYIFVKVFLKISNKPADKEHPFGHKQMEMITSIVIGSFIVVTAIAIFSTSISSLYSLLTGELPYQTIGYITLYIAGFTVLTKIGAFIYTRYIAKLTKNIAISALAADHKNDIFAALAVVIGIVFALRNIYWVDSLAGVFVSIFILKTGIDIIKESADSLMHIAPNDEMQNLVNTCAEQFNGSLVVKSVLSHRYGASYSLNITIGVCGNMSMTDAEKLAEDFEKHLLAQDSNLKYVFIQKTVFAL
jgi:cation diffusion facilitator family transporter